MNLTRAEVRGEVGEAGEVETGDVDNGLSTEDDGVVIQFEGRISWNVMGALPGLTDGLWGLCF
jgi:hypothetical protein